MIYYFVVLKHRSKEHFIEEFYQSFIFGKKRVLIKEDERINGFWRLFKKRLPHYLIFLFTYFL